MNACYLIILLLVFWFQSVCGFNQNAALDKNYSDRLTETNNHQSGLQPNANANHATVLPTANRFAASAATTTDPSQMSHNTFHLAANENSRFRRSNNDSDDDDDGGYGDDSTETGPILNGGGIAPQDNGNDAKAPINFLRLYFCGPGYRNCLYDERMNNVHVQNEFLKQIPRLVQATLPTNYLDWKSKPQTTRSIDAITTPGRRGFGIDEPHFMLIHSNENNPRHSEALLSGPELMDDPFIPQRGRRQSNAQTYDDPFYPMRGRRQAWDDPFFPMRGRRAASQQQAWDDPFFPMRGRRADAWDDPFFPMRGRRSDKSPKTTTWDDPFVPMRGRRRITKDNGKRAKPKPWDDPFVPMRGRRLPRLPVSLAYDDPFIPMRGRRSIQQKDEKPSNNLRRKRDLLAPTTTIGTFMNTVYTPTDEVIVKLNGIQDNHKIEQQQTKTNQLIEGTTSVQNAPQQQQQQLKQQHQKKSYYLLDDFATNPDDGDNGLMNDYATDYYVESPSPSWSSLRMGKNAIDMNKPRWMKSSRDLSQNRDAGNLARGSGTSLLF